MNYFSTTWKSVPSEACSKLTLAGRFHLDCQRWFISSGCLECLEKDSKVESRLRQETVSSLIGDGCQENKGAEREVRGTVGAEEWQ